MTGLRRLRELAEIVVPAINPEKLDMRVYMYTCGTVGCIAGHAACYPPFVEEGLHLEDINNWEYKAICFETETGASAVEEFFGISTDQFDYMFGSDSYPSPRPPLEEVIGRIKDVIKSKREGESNV